MTANSKRNRGNGAAAHARNGDAQVGAGLDAAGNGGGAPGLIAALTEPVVIPRRPVTAPVQIVFPAERDGATTGPVTAELGPEGPSGNSELSQTVRLHAPAVISAEAEGVQIQGNVDGLDSERRLAGWAWTAAAQPDDAVAIRVYENDVLLAQGSADHHRPDVKSAGYGEGKAGFLLPLPDSVFDGSIHRFEVRMAFAGGRLTRTHDVFLPSTRFRNSQLPARETKSGRPGELYVPGHVVTYAAGMPMPAYHSQGWGELDDSGAWLQGTDAVLEFVIRRPIDSYILEIDVCPGPFKANPPTLELYFNYMRVGFASVPVSRFISCRLPSELFVLRKSIIGFHCRDALQSGHVSSRVLALRRWTIY